MQRFSKQLIPLSRLRAPLSGLLMLMLTGWCYGLPVAMAALREPALDPGIELKPLRDSAPPGPAEEEPGPVFASPVFQGGAKKQGTATQPPAQSPMLTGKVQTLQEAIESERGIVDWYGWYLSARAYLAREGGINCPLGTPIKFYRAGMIQPLTLNPICQTSLMGRRFPLPRNTRLDALILPVRPGQGPPASPEEIYSRVQSRERSR